MTYRAIGLMSGSSLDGLDIVFVSFEEVAAKWQFKIVHKEYVPYTAQWCDRLTNASALSAAEYVQLDNDYGRYLGQQVNIFIAKNNLEHQVQLIASHGHTVFHAPQHFVTSQIGNGAQIAALTGINVVDQLRSLDVALGGQGAPIVPLGERLLFKDYAYFLNLGGIANLTLHQDGSTIAFDVCVANQTLNYYAQKEGLPYDKEGLLAQKGNIHAALLAQLKGLDFHQQAAPKSLSNQYLQQEILPIIKSNGLSNADILHTYTTYIASQIATDLSSRVNTNSNKVAELLVTGGGAFNSYLMLKLVEALQLHNIRVIVPEEEILFFKEALIMAFLGVLRWREENTVLNITGAQHPSIGGAVWIGQEY